MKRKVLWPARTFTECWMGTASAGMGADVSPVETPMPGAASPKTKAGSEKEEGSVFRRQHMEIPFLAAVS